MDGTKSAAGSYEAAMQRAHTLIDIKKWDRALEEIRQAIVAEPEDEYAHYLAGYCQYRLSKYVEARNEANAAISLEPNYAHAHWLISNIALQTDKYKEGFRAIDRALELDPQEPLYLATRAALLIDSGKPEEALKTAEQALAINPEHNHAAKMRALALTSLGRHTEAAHDADAIVSKDPGSDSALAGKGAQLFAQGRIEEARTITLEALRLNPENEMAQDIITHIIAMKHPFFALFWKWAFFLARFGREKRFVIILGICAFMRLLGFTARRNPKLLPIILPVVLLWALFCIYTWIAGPLFKMAIRKGWLE